MAKYYAPKNPPALAAKWVGSNKDEMQYVLDQAYSTGYIFQVREDGTGEIVSDSGYMAGEVPLGNYLRLRGYFDGQQMPFHVESEGSFESRFEEVSFESLSGMAPYWS